MKIYLSRPHMSGTEQREVARAFESNFIAPLGPHVDEFEKLVSERLGGGLHCVALSSGSAALHLALRVAGVRAGDHVWASSMTFAGGIFPVNYLGAVPTFFDLSPTHWTIDVDLVERHLEQCATKPGHYSTDHTANPLIPRLESIAKSMEFTSSLTQQKALARVLRVERLEVGETPQFYPSMGTKS